MNLVDFIRPDIIRMKAYKPIVPFDVLSRRLGRASSQIIKLDANENPYGPSPRARQALASLEYPHIYPDPEATALRQAIASRMGLPMENILASAGADELVDLIMRLFLSPGDCIIDCPPTFGMYAFDAALNGASVIEVPRGPDFRLDLEQISAVSRNVPRPKLLFLATPNNPDGSVLSDAELRQLLDLPLGIILDEAYVEFQGEDLSRASRVLERVNLMVLRTFSKRAGLAGLRAGYGVFPLALMPHLWKIKQPYNVNTAASAAAIASLEDQEYLARVLALITGERERLLRQLASLDFLRPYPSQGNFVLCRVVGRDAFALQQALEQEGILIRHFNRPGLADCLRISVGKPEHTDALIAALRRLTSSPDRG